MRVPWTSRRSNQSILKEINSLEGNGEEILKEIPHWRDWYWSLNSNTLATWWKKPSRWKRPWCWERLRAGEEGGTEDKMVGWYHWLNGQEFEQTLTDSEGQGSLAFCSPWGHKESGTTWQLNNGNNSMFAFTGSFSICNFLVSGCDHLCVCVCVLREVPLTFVCKAVLVVLNCLSCCLSVNLLISPSNLSVSLAG